MKFKPKYKIASQKNFKYIPGTCLLMSFFSNWGGAENTDEKQQTINNTKTPFIVNNSTEESEVQYCTHQISLANIYQITLA